MFRVEENKGEGEFPVPTVYDAPCPDCGMDIRIAPDMKRSDYTQEAKEYIQRFEEGFEKTINDLQEMFPDTPIKEYMDERCENLRKAITLLKRSFDEGLNFKERCELENIMEDS